jgi:hypothetical protein
MEKQNVTLSLPKDILRKAKLMAVERETSLSGLLVQLLMDAVHDADCYEDARQRNIARLQQGFDLGTNGMISWTRDELHER